MLASPTTERTLRVDAAPETLVSASEPHGNGQKPLLGSPRTYAAGCALSDIQTGLRRLPCRGGFPQRQGWGLSLPSVRIAPRRQRHSLKLLHDALGRPPGSLSGRSQSVDDLVMFRKSAGLVLAEDSSAVNHHVKNAPGPLDELRLDSNLLGDRLRQTGGLGVVVSLTAVCDGDVHRIFCSSAVSPSSRSRPRPGVQTDSIALAQAIVAPPPPASPPAAYGQSPLELGRGKKDRAEADDWSAPDGPVWR